VGDKVIGVVVDIDERLSDFNEGPYPLVTINRDDDNTEVAVHCFHTVLKQEIAKKRPQVGDHIGIKYLGIPDGRKYELYKVVLERPTRIDYERMAAEAKAELADSDELTDDDAPGFEDQEF
jgi:hypothetical protein